MRFKNLIAFIILVNLGIFWNYKCNAQAIGQQRLDSLLSVLNQNKQLDSTRFRTLIKISSDYLQIAPDKSIEYTNEAMQIAVNLNNKNYIAIAYRIIGNYYSVKSNYSKSLENFFAALKIQEEIGNKLEKASLLTGIGWVYQYQGDYKKALEYIYNAIKIYEPLNFKSGLAGAYNNLSIIFFKQDNYEKALEYMQKSLDISLEMKNKSGEATVLNNIANVYTKQKNYYEALKYYFRNLNLAKETNNNMRISQALCNIGNVYEGLEDYSKAMDYYTNAVEKSKEMKYDFGIILNLANIGGVQYKLSTLKQDQKTYYLKEALKYLKKADSISMKLQIVNSRLFIDSLLFKVYRDLADWKNAYFHLTSFHNIKDSIYSNENKNALELMNDKLESSLKQNEYEIATKENIYKQTKLNVLIISFAALTSLALFLLFYYKNKQKIFLGFKTNIVLLEKENIDLESLIAINNEIVNEFSSKKQEVDNIISELSNENLLKDKLLLFIVKDFQEINDTLKNLLDELLLQAKNNDLEKVNSVSKSILINAGSALEILDYILLWSNYNLGKIDFHPFQNSIHELISFNLKSLKALTENQNIRIHYSISENYHVYCDPNFINAVLRNLLTNAIKFNKFGGEIYIEARLIKSSIKEDFLQISIEDTGIGIPEKDLEHLFQIENIDAKKSENKNVRSGFGLLLCKNFIERHNGKIRAESIYGIGTKFIFTLPYSDDKN